ncbi:Hcp family type VI secretion system effector [Pseudomonas sp. MAFF 730085]|uniref:Hcp family type VI secretion system effector n=1 Tax=Pseudomonas kitaguniensis TaxID=2607908 RepID=A0A5N7JPH4_9PSED|nr:MULTISPECIES: Hcp family type VI secretion system effector [Pseudomonas]MPQ83297.1 Hcp family type VI secretion system effector [Pseudomonas kitaguniensis]PHN27274.1 type VI secretion system protein [Pseudomonas sp. ICMP 460]
MANHGYMSISGAVQGLISAGCSTTASIGNKCQDGHRDEIMVLSFQHNMANRGNLRGPAHGPVVITKNIDKSSPLLAVALANREELDCLIHFYRTSSFGQQEKYYTVDIRGCIVADLILDVPYALLQNDMDAQEHVALRYREILWTHHPAGTSGYAAWDVAQ